MTATSSNELFQVKIGNYHSYTSYFVKLISNWNFTLKKKVKVPKTYIGIMFVSQL